MNDLETNLKVWCKEPESNEVLFNESIYLPMKYLAASICSKYKVKKDIEETISDMVSHVSIILPEKYNEKKGKAKSMLYILMSQYLLDRIRRDGRGKRNIKNLIFIEDMESDKAMIVEVSIDNIQYLKESLLNNRQLFNNMNGKLEQRIKETILQCIETPEQFDCQYNSYVKSIAKFCKTNINKVYETLKTMNFIVTEHSSLAV